MTSQVEGERGNKSLGPFKLNKTDALRSPKLLFSRPPYPIKRGADSDLYQRQGLYAE